ncbi:uncharacterized protein C2845_PM12G25670 [Panicum miliaceum]|uniref:Uncharacterized protein n=1 Tax=Panicum miliaceum TaxID=4540 RepID=A0A3L6QGN3_PANMI|nr:uncharacterized protein C2845_PM12G25670 [Panicum miliaceum]
MDSATVALASPASDDRRFWDRLRTRVDTILDDRHVLPPPAAAAKRGVESERGKRLREDSLMLVRGLDSVAASLAQLSDTLTAAQKLAVSMASRAAALARELKNIKSELHFMQERCGLLEEENKRLREGYDNGAAPEEDDLVRLQLEALLAEKSRLAQENANLTRENQSLMQLVEYHQLTSQDLDESYEDVMQGMRLDFSSPLGKISDDEEGEYDDGVPVTPAEVLSSPDE